MGVVVLGEDHPGVEQAGGVAQRLDLAGDREQLVAVPEITATVDPEWVAESRTLFGGR